MKANKVSIGYRLGEKGKGILIDDFRFLKENLEWMKKNGASQDDINEEGEMIRILKNDIGRIENLKGKNMILDKRIFSEKDRKIYFDRLKSMIKQREERKREDEKPIRFEDILILMDKIIKNHRNHTILSKTKKYSVLEPYYDESLFYEYSALEKLYYSQEIFSINGSYLFLNILKIMQKHGMNKLTRGALTEKEKERMNKEIKDLTELLEDFKERPDCYSPYLRDRFIARALKRDIDKESLMALKYWLGEKGRKVLEDEIGILRELLERMKIKGAYQSQIRMLWNRIMILKNDVKRIEELEKNVKTLDIKSMDQEKRIYFDKIRNLLKKGELNYWRKKKIEFDEYLK